VRGNRDDAIFVQDDVVGQCAIERRAESQRRTGRRAINRPLEEAASHAIADTHS
jgi:hypothetical protein